MNSSVWWRWIAFLAVLIAFQPTLVQNAPNFEFILNNCENCTFNRAKQCEHCYKLHQDPCIQKMEFISNESIAEARSSILQCSTVNVDCWDARTSKYRTIDGSCNNLRNPSWGKSITCLRRILPHDYGDDKSYPRQSCIKGKELPNAREISNYFHKEVENVPGLDFHTNLFMEFGQFCAHDLSYNDIQPTKDRGETDCCCPKAVVNDLCISVDVPEDDPFYKERGRICHPVVRTKPCHLCTCGKREGLNEVTSYMDLSVVYGSNKNISNSLRSFRDGMLKVQEIPDVGSLPPGANTVNECDATDSKYKCFVTGDNRANLHLLLTTYHIFFLRYHNVLCRKLKDVNPCWDDEKLFQEARRINIAQLQCIFFGHYIRLVLGSIADDSGLSVKGIDHGFNLAPEFDIKHLSSARDAEEIPALGAKPEPELDQKPGCSFTTYDPSLDASMVDECTSTAFRFGHTMVRNFFPCTATSTNMSDLKLPDGMLPGVEPLIPSNKKKGFKIDEDHIKFLRDYYNYPDEFYQKPFTDGLAQGSALFVAWKVDPLLGEDVRDYLLAKHYEVEKGRYDLAATSIARGRDHGTPGYTYYLKHFFNYDVKTFCDLKKFIPKDFLKKLRSLYKSVHDIDLYSAGLAEYHLKGGIVGPTFAAILMEQFKNTKYGDRYYFEHGNQAGSFTPEQLREIKKTTLSKIICETTQVKVMQKNCFFLPQPSNPLLPCKLLDDLDFIHWKEKC